MSPHTQQKRKQLGAYYTPIDLSQVLTDWAIRSPNDKVLEPSFGGCGFLEACVETFRTMGCEEPAKSLHGADIDVKAFDFLSEKLGQLVDVKSGYFKKKDFLKLKPKSFSGTDFDVVIGNPPYVSLHNMSKAQRDSCFNVLEKSSYADGTIGRNASLWAYFLIHTLDFIKDGGRVAWVLPSSLLHADYANAVMKIHKRHFSSLKVIKIYERFFQGSGADEVSVILIAEGFSKHPRSTPSSVAFAVANDVAGLKQAVETAPTINKHENYRYYLIERKALTDYQFLSNGHLGNQLGNIAKVLIGMVTGDNKTFIIDRQKKSALGLDDHMLKPVISKFSHLSGFLHTKNKHEKLIEENKKCLLISPDSIIKRYTPIRKYLASVSKSERKKNRTFPKRANWFEPDDKLYPDAFLSYMIHKGPRLVINSANINCTNSVHRVYFTQKFTYREKKAIAMSLYSSFSQLSAELEGRSYGSGVLKLEPTPAKKIRFLISDKIVEELNRNHEKINHLVTKGDLCKARTLIDHCICEAEGLELNSFVRFGHAIEQLRNERYKGLRTT